MVSAAPNATAVTAAVLASRPRDDGTDGWAVLTLQIRSAAAVPGMAEVLAPVAGDQLDVLADVRPFGGVDIVGRVLDGVISMAGPGVVRLESSPAARLIG